MLYQLSYEATDFGSRSIVGWELLASNVLSVCTGLNVLVVEDVSILLRFHVLIARANQRTQGVMGSMQTTGARQGQIPHICTL